MICEMMPANCPYKGCYKVLEYKELERHRQSCQYRFTTCGECGKKYETKKVKKQNRRNLGGNSNPFKFSSRQNCLSINQFVKI